MSKFVIKHIKSLTSLAYSPNSHNLFYFIRIHPFCASSTSLKGIDSCSNRSSFTVDYLINSCGLTPERAFSASKYVTLQVADNANSVLKFFKDEGFTQTQISKLINSAPSFLLRNAEKTLLPKIEFLKSKGFSGSEVAEIVSTSPHILTSSLKNHLIPFFNIYRNLHLSDEKTIAAFKRYAGNRWHKTTKHIEVNIDMLKQAGAPIKYIGFLMTYHPRIFVLQNDRFRQTVEEVTKLGFDSSKVNFLIAIQALNSMSKSTWDRKVEVYKKWGWSENEIVVAFRKHPSCMIVSEDKINSVMEFWVNKMGWKSSILANWPRMMSYSLGKRVVPRCEVYQFLISNRLRKPADISVFTMLKLSENDFRERFVDPYKEDAPDLSKLYELKLNLAN